jgi:hypothetical protein
MEMRLIMVNKLDEMDDYVTVELDLDEGRVECLVDVVFECDGRDYVALLPLDENGEETGDVYLYRYSVDKSGEPQIEYIPDEDEYEAAADKYDEYLDELVYEDVVTEEEQCENE